MQDPDRTILDPQGFRAPGQPSGQAPQPPYGQPQGQFPQPSQPPQGPNVTPGQAPGRPPQQSASQTPSPPALQKKFRLLWVILTIAVLIVVGLVLLVVSMRNTGFSAPPQSTNTTAQNASSTKAPASASTQSSAPSANSTPQAQATSAATPATQTQPNNAPTEAEQLAKAGPPATVAKSFFDAIKKQDYNTAYELSSFKKLSSADFHSTSATSDQTLGKLTAYTISKTTISSSAGMTTAHVTVSISRANIPTHNGTAVLVLENGTWKITDGTIWQ